MSYWKDKMCTCLGLLFKNHHYYSADCLYVSKKGSDYEIKHNNVLHAKHKHYYDWSISRYEKCVCFKWFSLI